MAARTLVDDPKVCAACGATDRQLRHPTVPDERRPFMRVCVEDKPCADRYSARRRSADRSRQSAVPGDDEPQENGSQKPRAEDAVSEA